MNADQAKRATAWLVGMWPEPRMTDDEAKALGAVLSGYEGRELRRAVSDLQAGKPRPLRPGPGELLAAMRAAREREVQRSAPRELPASPADWHRFGAGLAAARAALETCRPWRDVPVPTEGSGE